MKVSSPIVTCFSCIASKSADCTFAGALLISSARTKFAKTGPFFTENFDCLTLYSWVPTTSAGNKSGVNCILLKLPLIAFDNVFIAKVLAKPGTPSSNIWPLLVVQ